MPNRSKRILTHVTIILIAFAAGACAGILLYPEVYGVAAVADVHEDHPAHEDDHLDLTEQAVANLKLELGRVEVGDYWQQDTFPGEVVEIPGQSDLSVAAPVTGVIEQVSIRDGQTVELGDQLFSLRITDPAITSAQAQLLSVLSRLEVDQMEIDRLGPLTDEGIVGKNRERELKYSVQKLEAEKLTKIQEILAHGLPEHTLDRVLKTRQLAKRIYVSVPNYMIQRRPAANDFTRQVGLTGKPSFSIGSIHGHAGRAVKKGEHLCELSYHGRLYIRGQAFESDVAAISKMCELDWRVTAEFGHQHHEGHQHTFKRKDLKITRIDNHVDPATQTFSFYIPIDNDVVQEVTTEDRLYQQWRFRPGQRVHLRLPVSKYEGKIKIPVEALAMEGPNAVVFRKHSHGEEDVSLMVGVGGVGVGLVGEPLDHAGHDHDDDGHDDDDHDHDAHAGHDHDAHAGHDHDAHAGHDHAHEDVFLQLEPVPVHVLHRGHDFAIIETNGELHADDEIALNAAYKLQLAMQMAAGGGGGHDHGHEH